MFNDNQQTAGATTAQNPSMLDNVNSVPSTNTPVPDPVTTPQDNAQPRRSMTSDNPFTQSTTTTTVPPSRNPTSSDPIVDVTPTVVASASGLNNTPMSDVRNVPQPVATPSSPIVPPTPVATATPTASTDDDGGNTEDTQASAPAIDTDKLADMKKQALDHLEPLVKHLDGTPEETFKTTMMMIQANDNHTLLDKALSSAKKITDDRERAQALLDIVNEINYFSQGTIEE